MQPLVIATRNAGKLREIRKLLEGSAFEVRGLDAWPQAPEVDEDGETFVFNAEKKARVIAAFTGCLTLADDSGLVVPALSGAPGVHSARYAGPEATDADNNQKLLATMTGLTGTDRKAAFRCSMVLATPTATVAAFDGELQGSILDAGRGSDGFGYDPLFLVREYGQTLAELPLEVKNRISHRGAALRKVLTFLQQQLDEKG